MPGRPSCRETGWKTQRSDPKKSVLPLCTTQGSFGSKKLEEDYGSESSSGGGSYGLNAHLLPFYSRSHDILWTCISTFHPGRTFLQVKLRFPGLLSNVVVEAESKQGAVVWSSAQKDPPAIPTDSLPLKLVALTGNDIQRHLPETLHVEATGLGGRDLSYPIPWDISIRTDKEGQSVYGPSLAPLEETVVVPGILGGQKPCRSLHWAGVKLPMNSWCFTTLPWTAPNIGKNS